MRSGKSYVDIADTILRRLLEVKDKEGLNVIIGVAKETIERNVLQPMREIYGGTYISQINSRNLAYLFGIPVYCLGAEKANAINVIQGMSVKYCYGDEIAKWNEGVFHMLQSRLDKPYSKFDGACNRDGLLQEIHSRRVGACRRSDLSDVGKGDRATNCRITGI